MHVRDTETFFRLKTACLLRCKSKYKLGKKVYHAKQLLAMWELIHEDIARELTQNAGLMEEKDKYCAAADRSLFIVCIYGLSIYNSKWISLGSYFPSYWLRTKFHQFFNEVKPKSRHYWRQLLQVSYAPVATDRQCCCFSFRTDSITYVFKIFDREGAQPRTKIKW